MDVGWGMEGKAKAARRNFRFLADDSTVIKMWQIEKESKVQF